MTTRPQSGQLLLIAGGTHPDTEWIARSLGTAAQAWNDDAGLDELLTHYLRDNRRERWDFLPLPDKIAETDPIFDYYSSRLAGLIDARIADGGRFWRAEPDGGNLLRLWRAACEKSRAQPRLSALLIIEPPMSAAFALAPRLPASSLTHALYAVTVNLIELERHSRGLTRVLVDLMAAPDAQTGALASALRALNIEGVASPPPALPPAPLTGDDLPAGDDSIRRLWAGIGPVLTDWEALGDLLDATRAQLYPRLDQAGPFCEIERQRFEARLMHLSANARYFEDRMRRFTEEVLDKWYFKLGYKALKPRETLRGMTRRARSQAGRTLRRLLPHD